jgi:hypothetical protein
MRRGDFTAGDILAINTGYAVAPETNLTSVSTGSIRLLAMNKIADTGGAYQIRSEGHAGMQGRAIFINGAFGNTSIVEDVTHQTGTTISRIGGTVFGFIYTKDFASMSVLVTSSIVFTLITVATFLAGAVGTAVQISLTGVVVYATNFFACFGYRIANQVAGATVTNTAAAVIAAFDAFTVGYAASIVVIADFAAGATGSRAKLIGAFTCILLVTGQIAGARSALGATYRIDSAFHAGTIGLAVLINTLVIGVADFTL